MRRIFHPTLNPLQPADQTSQEAATDTVVYVSPGTQQYHPAHPKAIVVFNGTSGAISPVFAYNVTVVTANAAGDFTIQFITPFSTSGYGATINAEATGTNIPDQVYVVSGTMLASSVRINTRSPGGTLVNFDHTTCIFYGDQ